jgi:hypothetical protein
MKFLLERRFAPTTLGFGFIRAAHDDVKATVTKWRSELREHFQGKWNHQTDLLNGSLAEMLSHLEPLTSTCSRELWVSTSGGSWTAYFGNTKNGTDADPVISYLAGRLKCKGMTFNCVPDRSTAELAQARKTYGSTMFRVFNGEGAKTMENTGSALVPMFENVQARSVGVANDGGDWVFINSGEPLAFEKLAFYEKSRLIDRFTPDLLEEYCRELGIQVFDEDFYGPRGLLIVRDISSFPKHVQERRTYAQLHSEMRWDLD